MRWQSYAYYLGHAKSLYNNDIDENADAECQQDMRPSAQLLSTSGINSKSGHHTSH